MDQFKRFVQDIGIKRGNRGHRIAYIAHLVNRQRVFVLAGGQDTKLLREVLAGNHSQHAR